MKRQCLPETQAPEEEEEEEEESEFRAAVMQSLYDINSMISRIAVELVDQKEKMCDLHSMISALSPTQEIKKEDYERMVARSAKEAESLKKASDSLPTKRAKKEEPSS